MSDAANMPSSFRGPNTLSLMAVTEDVKIRTKASDPSRFVEVLESEENRIFYDFLGFIQDRRKLAIPHESVLGDSTATKEALDAARQVLTSLGEQVGLEQKRILKEYPEYLFAKYLNMVIEPEIPEVPGNIVNEQDLQYRWYRNHYWDRVDFSDPRLVHDGSFHQILDTYWTRVLPQMPDSMVIEAERLISKVEGNDEMVQIQHALHHVLTRSLHR